MSSSHSDAARMEQIITEFFAKSLHIILETRSPFMSSRNFSSEQIMSSPSSSSSSSSSVRPRDKWFNLALRECPEAMENLDLWRQSNLEPMVVDVILVKRDLNWAPISYSPKPELVKNDASSKEVCCFSDQEELGSEQRSEKVIERWVVQYELKKTRDSGKSGKRSSSNVLSILYKKSMLLLRSLYLTVRLLPAYKIFRDLNLTGQIHSFSLMHRVSSFAEPFTRREEAEMQRFVFTPVDTQCGRLCLSVLYQSSGSDMSSGPSTPMSPRFIPDYVGSPLADPLKKFSSVPTSHGSPSLPFSRRHSWSFDRSRASPTSVSYSPSPNSEPYGPASNPASHRVPPASLPINPPEPHPHKGSPCFDEFCPSPVFSPSPSPSPPIYAHGSQLPNPLLRSESAPVNIPTRKLPNSPSLLRNQHLPPSPPLRGSRCNSYKTDKAVVPTHIGATVDKMVAAGKEDRRYTGMRIPLGSSLQISLSRSSSRSYDYDETEYTCPFDMEYDDIMKTGNRPESFDLRGHLREPLEPGALLPVRKSQGAAVGTLVYMLSKAQPLSQEYSQSIITASSQPSITETGSIPEVPPRPLQDSNSITASSSSVRVLKTTADALEELKGYRDIKNMLLKSSPA